MSSDRSSPQNFLKTLFVKDFRNIAELSLQLGEGHHLFIGHNGHGKTNCLEAIALACSLKPMQSLQNAELIRFGTEHAKIIAGFDGLHAIDVDVDVLPRGKKAKLNDHPLRKSTQLAKHCSLVSFIPSELNLITGPHSLRRRALDQATAALFVEHAATLRAYEKILQNRNRLLKDAPYERDTLAIFTELLMSEGAKLMHARARALAQMRDIFADMLKSILGGTHEAKLSYCVNDLAINDYALGDLEALLHRMKDDVAIVEQRRRVTLFGPHLDDVTFLLNGVDAKSFASRGQSRALVFAFKLAQMMAILRVRGFAPIIILDDIVSELDSAIKANLVETVTNLCTQVFFSTTDRETFGSKFPLDRVFLIRDGALILD